MNSIVLPPSQSKARSLRGQAMLELVFLLPLLLIVFIWMTALAPVLDLKQRTVAATWYVLRGESVDSHHRSSVAFEEEVKTKLFPDYSGKVQVDVDNKLDGLSGALQVLDAVTWYVIPKEKCVTIQVSDIPFVTPGAGSQINRQTTTVTSPTMKMIYNNVDPP